LPIEVPKLVSLSAGQLAEVVIAEVEMGIIKSGVLGGLAPVVVEIRVLVQLGVVLPGRRAVTRSKVLTTIAPVLIAAIAAQPWMRRTQFVRFSLSVRWNELKQSQATTCTVV
jgi:hypothetical protein